MRRSGLVTAMILSTAPLAAQMPAYALGAVVGEPTGVSGKMWLSRYSAIDAVVGFSFARGTAFTVQMDYLFHIYDVIDPASGVAPIYVGAGARIKTEGETRFGLRIPVGVEYIFDDTPLDLFLEGAPILDLTPDVTFRFNIVVGFRFFIPWEVPVEL